MLYCNQDTTIVIIYLLSQRKHVAPMMTLDASRMSAINRRRAAALGHTAEE